MGRDKIKSASLHGFHDEHVEPLPPTPAAGTRTPFETLVREMLAQLGDDPTREGLRQTPTRVEASLKWLTLMKVLDPRGVGVLIEAYHLCMMMRGVEKQNSKTITSALRGALLQDAKTRDEFLRLVYSGRGRG